MEAPTSFGRCTKPVVAMVRGYALGGGPLALACDLRIASESAQFGLPEVTSAGFRRGWTQYLPRLVGRGMAAYLLYTGEHRRDPGEGDRPRGRLGPGRHVGGRDGASRVLDRAEPARALVFSSPLGWRTGRAPRSGWTTSELIALCYSFPDREARIRVPATANHATRRRRGVGMAAFVSAAEAAVRRRRHQATVVLSGNTWSPGGRVRPRRSRRASWRPAGPDGCKCLPDRRRSGPAPGAAGHRREPAGQGSDARVVAGSFSRDADKELNQPSRRTRSRPTTCPWVRSSRGSARRRPGSWPRDTGRDRYIRRSPAAGWRMNGATHAARRARDPGGEEALFYPRQPIDVAIVKGTTADEHGNIARAGDPSPGRGLLWRWPPGTREYGHRRGDAHGGRRDAPSESGGHPRTAGGLRRGGARGVRG